MSGRTIARATIVVMVMSLLSRLLGLGRETAIAHQFGATGATDAYLVAYTIPNIFYAVAGLALATVIVPVFTGYITNNRREEAWRLCSLVMNALVAVTAAAAVLGMFGAPLIAGVLGQGFPPETIRLAAQLTAIMIPSIIFFSLAGLFMGILNANNVFGVPAFGSAAMNIVIIFGALVLGEYYGIYGLAAGALGGAAAMALIQWPVLRRLGFKYSFEINFGHPEVKRVLYLMLPLTLALSVNQVYLMIDWILASGLAEGSIASLNYANKLIQLPQSLFVLAISTAIFPTLSRHISEGHPDQMAETLRRGIKVVFLLTVPAGLGILLLRQPIVKLLFERGAFDEQASAMTAVALLFFAVGLVGHCLVMLLSRGFFAMKDMKTPLVVTFSTLVIKLGASLLLIPYLAHAGLALGTSITALLNMVILLILLQRRLPGVVAADLWRFTGGVVAASGIMAVIVTAVDARMAVMLGGDGFGLLTRLMVDIFSGSVVFFLAGILLKLDELIHIIGYVKSIITGKVAGFRT
ncbi:MAG: murein biosynthesis integral membrane protein MurJ [Peptococcaceae bacterium]|nr:murein biosynthesis integral membrane protein MurJ [Peptococcaceae bacterium]